MKMFNFIKKAKDNKNVTRFEYGDFINSFIRSTNITPPMDENLLKALLSERAITKEEALSIPAVSGAIDFISSSIASMPIKLYRNKKGNIEEKENDVRVKLLNGDTGDTLDAFQLKKRLIMDYFLDKGGYCYVQKARNTVTAIKYVDPAQISINQISIDPINKKYIIFVSNGKQYDTFEFIKLLRNTKNGVEGISLIENISSALKTALSNLLYQLFVARSGGAIKGYLTLERVVTQEDLDIISKKFKDAYTKNDGSIPILNGGIKYNESSRSSAEMQINETKKLLNDEINNVFHITNDFYDTFKEAIYPIIRAFEIQLNSVLLLESEKKNMFFSFDTKEMMKASLDKRFIAYRTAKDVGFTLNEIRQMENMNHINGLDVVNVGLGAVLYDINTEQYFTPNTGLTENLTKKETVSINKEKNISETNMKEKSISGNTEKKINGEKETIDWQGGDINVS